MCGSRLEFCFLDCSFCVRVCPLPFCDERSWRSESHDVLLQARSLRCERLCVPRVPKSLRSQHICELTLRRSFCHPMDVVCRGWTTLAAAHGWLLCEHSIRWRPTHARNYRNGARVLPELRMQGTCTTPGRAEYVSSAKGIHGRAHERNSIRQCLSFWL